MWDVAAVLVTYLLLAAAILAEVLATISLRLSNGFSRLAPSVVVIVGYFIALGLLAVVLKRGLPVSIAYAIWAGAGVTLVAGVGALLLDEKLTTVQVVGLAFIVAGVVAMEGGRSH